MRYFQLVADVVVGEYANPQSESMGLVQLPEDDSRVLAFRNPVKSLDKRKQEFYTANDLSEMEYIRALIKERGDADSSAINDFLARRKVIRNKSDFPK